MSKMRKAFYTIKPDGTEAEYVLFFAGFQAAIAAVKESAHPVELPDGRIVTRYQLLEDV